MSFWGRVREGRGLTLQDANMLCRVTQTATTLRTGDHSFPSIDAQIYNEGTNRVILARKRRDGRTHMTIGIHVLREDIRLASRCAREEGEHVRDG
jgi:hypothetical protein